MFFALALLFFFSLGLSGHQRGIDQISSLVIPWWTRMMMLGIAERVDYWDGRPTSWLWTMYRKEAYLA